MMKKRVERIIARSLVVPRWCQQRPLVEARAALNNGVVKEGTVTRPTSTTTTTTTTTRNKTPLSSFHLFDQGEDENENTKNNNTVFRIDAHTDEWFEIDREELRSSIFVHKNFRALWKPKGASDVSVDSLIYLKLLDEIPDVILFGTGKQTKQIPEDSVRWAREMGMAVEVMDTANCVATFNVLVEEGRNVACGILRENSDDDVE
jgi:NADH dehydrogenase [ubiquinone] 1 alpha subcomplex assembly factor 3